MTASEGNAKPQSLLIKRIKLRGPSAEGLTWPDIFQFVQWINAPMGTMFT